MKWFGRKKDKPKKNTVSEEKEIETPELSSIKDNPEKKEAKKSTKDIPEKEELSQEPEKEKKISEKSADSLPKSQKGFVSRLRTGLSKTRQILTTDIDELLTGGRKIDDDFLEELEERLITSDIGVETTMKLMERISKKASKMSDATQLKKALKAEILSLFSTHSSNGDKETKKPHVIMVVGINGVGKTTTIGKLAAKFANQKKKVLIGASDTFRAAAVEQLAIWADRAGAEIVRHRDNADPAAVAYDSIEAAVARGKDILLIDTAGRLHTKVNLMEELKKIKRAISKKMPDAPHEVLLVLDATTGQNAMSQTQMFNEALGISGIALTKLDGTAKGGIVINICSTFDIPLKYIGIGESIEDLQEFKPVQFVDAIF